MLVVQKYGGTSVGNPERILLAADRIARRRERGDRVVVVVSAMGKTTNELTELARRITPFPSRRELDMLLTTGERISMSLLSMALNTRNVPAISFTGSQSGILTDTSHTRARILELRPIRIGPELERGRVVIVAGFQGVSQEKEITTLGRGGGDTTAIALAAGLHADACEIYSDVPGVMTADPRQAPAATLVPRFHWDVMVELAGLGAGIVHVRAAELAHRHRIAFSVRSAFSNEEGTIVEGTSIEPGPAVEAVTGRSSVSRARVTWPLPENLDLCYEYLERLESVCELRHCSRSGQVTVDFHLAGEEPEWEAFHAEATEAGATCSLEPGWATVSLVGPGLGRDPSVAARAHRVLRDEEILPRETIAGNLSLTFLVEHHTYAKAQSVLHREFLEPGK